MWKYFKQNLYFDETSFFLTIEGRLALLTMADKSNKILLTASQVYQIQCVWFMKADVKFNQVEFIYYRQVQMLFQKLYFSNFLTITTFLVTHYPVMVKSKLYNDLVFSCLQDAGFVSDSNGITFDCSWLEPKNKYTMRTFWYKRRFWEAKLYRQSFHATAILFFLILLDPWYTDKNYLVPKEFWYNLSGFECTPSYYDEELYIEEV